MVAVPWLAAEAGQGEGPGGRKLASLSMDERRGAAIPYSEARSQARSFGRRRVRQRHHTRGVSDPPGPLPERPIGQNRGGRSRPDSSCCSRGPAAQNAAALSACVARRIRGRTPRVAREVESCCAPETSLVERLGAESRPAIKPFNGPRVFELRAVVRCDRTG